MHVVQAHVDDVREGNQAAAKTDHHRMPAVDVRGTDQQAGDEKADAGNQEQEGTETAMLAQAEGEADRCQHDGERDECAFDSVIGQKSQSQRRQHAEDHRQQCAVHGTEQRCERAEAVDGSSQSGSRQSWRATFIHGDLAGRIHDDSSDPIWNGPGRRLAAEIARRSTCQAGRLLLYNIPNRISISDPNWQDQARPDRSLRSTLSACNRHKDHAPRGSDPLE